MWHGGKSPETKIPAHFEQTLAKVNPQQMEVLMANLNVVQTKLDGDEKSLKKYKAEFALAHGRDDWAVLGC